MQQTPVLAVANHKGGAGKTTTAYHLACSLARHATVLAVDLDDQGSLTARFGREDRQDAITVADVLLHETDVESAVIAAETNIHLLPADARLSWAAAKLQAMNYNHLYLAKALARYATGYDVIVLDCPPSAGIIIVNALMAATHLTIAATPTIESYDGALRMIAMLDELAEATNRRPQHLGIVATQVVANSKSHGAYLHQFGPDLLGCVPMRVGVDAAQQIAAAYQPIAERIWEKINHAA